MEEKVNERRGKRKDSKRDVQHTRHADGAAREVRVLTGQQCSAAFRTCVVHVLCKLSATPRQTVRAPWR